MLDKEEYSNEQTVESWVMEKCDHWRDHFTNNYEEKFDEYNRLWRGHCTRHGGLSPRQLLQGMRVQGSQAAAQCSVGQVHTA